MRCTYDDPPDVNCRAVILLGDGPSHSPPVTGSVCQLDAVWSQGFRLPAHVLVIPSNVLAINPDHILTPQHGINFSIASLLDHRDPAAEDCHAVALVQGSLPLASVVILRAFPDKVVQSRRIEAQSPPAEGDVLPAADDEDVSVIRGKGLKAGLHFLRAGWNQV